MMMIVPCCAVADEKQPGTNVPPVNPSSPVVKRLLLFKDPKSGNFIPVEFQLRKTNGGLK